MRMDILGKKKISCLCYKLNPRSSSVYTSHNIEYTILTPCGMMQLCGLVTMYQTTWCCTLQDDHLNNGQFYINLIFMFVWPCIVTNFFTIKPTRCTNFTNLFWHETLKCFRQFFCPSSGVYSLYTQQWYMSYGFVDSFRTDWFCSKAVYKPVRHIPEPSVQWINSWWWAEKLPETCRVSCKSKFGKLVHLVGFILKKNKFDCQNFKLSACAQLSYDNK
jgi:hypothetical protein